MQRRKADNLTFHASSYCTHANGILTKTQEVYAILWITNDSFQSPQAQAELDVQMIAK